MRAPAPYLLTLVILLAPCGVTWSAEADPQAQRAAQLELVDRRIAKNDAAIAELQTRRAALVTLRDETTAKLGQLDQQLAEVVKLSDKARAEANASRNQHATSATLQALEKANLALTPLQQSRKDWIRTVASAEATIVDIDRRLGGLDRRAQDLTRERAKLSEAQ